MRNSFLLAALVGTSLGCSSNWKLKETKAEMEDSVRYSAITESAREVKYEKGDPFRPFLSVAFEKNEASIRSGPGEMIHFAERGRFEGAPAWLGSVKVRFDDEEPMQADMVEMPTTNGRFVFLGPEMGLLTKMLKHESMKIQWVLAGGGTAIDTFKLGGLQSTLLKLCGKAPAACKRDTPIGGALASVGVEIAGGEKRAPDRAVAKSPCPSGQEFQESKFPGSQTIQSRGCASRSAAGALLRQGLTETFYHDGKKESVATYVDDALNGLKTKWHPNGQKWAEVTYKGGKEDGVGIQWFANGNKEMEFTYHAGVKDGPTAMWHENGQKSAVGTFVNGQIEGAFASWYPNGQKNEELTLKNGKKNGPGITWDPSGNKTELVFKDDKPVAPDVTAQPPEPQPTEQPETKTGGPAEAAAEPIPAPKIDSSVTVGAPTVMGSTSKDAVAKVANDNLAELRHCHDAALAKNAKASGSVILKVIISADGSVANAQMARSTLGDGDFESCVQARAKTWRFPTLKGGGIASVTLPLDFQPVLRVGPAAVARGTGEPLNLPKGTFAATSPQWKAGRDAVVVWCKANKAKCADDALELLLKPDDGSLKVPASGSATLTTCAPGNCMCMTYVEFARSGAIWNVEKVQRDCGAE